MIRTPLCDLLGITQPVVLGGMGNGTNAELVAAVTNAGGLGILGTSIYSTEAVREQVRRIRELTTGPFGVNHLLFNTSDEKYASTIDLAPKVVSTAWPASDQNLKPYFDRAHAAGCLVMHMVSYAPDAVAAVEAGADIIVAQGTEGGGHVGWMATMALLPMVVRAVAPVPVLAAGGVADGAGLAAALALGAEGVLLGTRFLATPEAPVPDGYKRAIVRSNGHNTFLTEIPDLAQGRVWPGAMSRIERNRFAERWVGREWEVRQRRAEIAAQMEAARARDDTEEYHLSLGQSAGLIDSIEPAGDIVRQIVEDAERIIRHRLVAMLD